MATIEIAKIKARDRLREDLGDLSGLIESVKKYGLIHPVVVTDDGILIAGARRLAACRELGMRVVEARRFGDLSPIERREIELEENLHRKDLTTEERSKLTVELKQAGAAAIKEEAAKNGEVLATLAKTHKGGRPPKDNASLQAIADRIGIPRKTIERAEEHVALAEKYALLKAPDWTQRAAIATGKALDTLGATERRQILSLVNESQACAKPAEKMIASWARAAPQIREKILGLARSKDERERSAIISVLADCAPEPDARSLALEEAARIVRKAAKRYPGDPMNKDCEEIAKRLEALAAKIDEGQEKRAKKAQEAVA